MCANPLRFIPLSHIKLYSIACTTSLTEAATLYLSICTGCNLLDFIICASRLIKRIPISPEEREVLDSKQHMLTTFIQTTWKTQALKDQDNHARENLQHSLQMSCSMSSAQIPNSRSINSMARQQKTRVHTNKQE